LSVSDFTKKKECGKSDGFGRDLHALKQKRFAREHRGKMGKGVGVVRDKELKLEDGVPKVKSVSDFRPLEKLHCEIRIIA
jgi:hypothetical protein